MVDLATEVKDVVARLRADAAQAHRETHTFERVSGHLGAKLAANCDEAASLLESLSSQVDALESSITQWQEIANENGLAGDAAESRATAAEGRVALLEVERDEMTVAANDYAHQAAKAMLRERELSETLAAFVQRFELYAGPNDMHAGKHDLELLTLGRARLAKEGQ